MLCEVQVYRQNPVRLVGTYRVIVQPTTVSQPLFASISVVANVVFFSSYVPRTCKLGLQVHFRTLPIASFDVQLRSLPA